MSKYIHQNPAWPSFRWNHVSLSPKLALLRHKQGMLKGRMESLGFSLKGEAMLQTLTLEVLKSNEIEGEKLDQEQVRSSIARRLGMEIAGLVPSDRYVEGVVDMTLDATQRYHEELTQARLFGWHAALFPAGRSGIYPVTLHSWRTPEAGPMQIVSGPMGRERVHFEAPEAARLNEEMKVFLDWFRTNQELLDPVVKAAIAHIWFVTIHPFDDGNGRIARAIADMQLARADESSQRFYSMSAQIRKERNAYYDILEKTQKGDMNITDWLEWFLGCLDRALDATELELQSVLRKARYWQSFADKKLSERQRLMLNKLLEGFEGKLTSSKWAKITRVSQDTASRDIQNLIDQGILVKEASGGRSTSYILGEDGESAR